MTTATPDRPTIDETPKISAPPNRLIIPATIVAVVACAVWIAIGWSNDARQAEIDTQQTNVEAEAS